MKRGIGALRCGVVGTILGLGLLIEPVLAVATAGSACSAMVMTLSACVHQRPAVLPTAPGILAGIVEGRVLWNEQPVAGARVYATDEYDSSSKHYYRLQLLPADLRGCWGARDSTQ